MPTHELYKNNEKINVKLAEIHVKIEKQRGGLWPRTLRPTKKRLNLRPNVFNFKKSRDEAAFGPEPYVPPKNALHL